MESGDSFIPKVIPFDLLTDDGKLSAIYGQLLDLHRKLNDVLAREATLEHEHATEVPPGS